MDNFPDEIISEILTRLPAKSIHRFKSVSKRWCSIIRNPLFVTSYIAHNTPSTPPPFYIVDRDILLSPPNSVAGRVELVPNPNVSQFFVNQTRLLSPHEVIPVNDESEFPDLVLQYDHGLLLFSVECYLDPNRRRKKRARTRFSNLFKDDYEFEHSLFVCNVITGECVRIPSPPYPLNNRLCIGFVTRVVEEDDNFGVVTKFVICDYQHLVNNDALIMCFSLDTGKWVVKETNRLHQCQPESALAYNGRLYWVVKGIGLISWDDDPFSASQNESKAVCRLISFPPRIDHTFAWHSEMNKRCKVGVSGGYIQFAAMMVSEDDMLLKLWRLSETESESETGNWILLYQVSKDYCETYMYHHLKITLPAVCFLHPFDVDVVYFQNGAYVFSYNFQSGKVVSIAKFGGNGECLPIVLPTWPTSLSPRLCAALAKEEGNELIMDGRFNEAISSYSKSINLAASAPAYAYRALAYLNVRRFQEGEDDCTSALRLNGHYVNVYAQRALARERLGNFQGSMEDIEYALKLEPNNEGVKKLHTGIESLILRRIDTRNAKMMKVEGQHLA